MTVTKGCLFGLIFLIVAAAEPAEAQTQTQTQTSDSTTPKNLCDLRRPNAFFEALSGDEFSRAAPLQSIEQQARGSKPNSEALQCATRQLHQMYAFRSGRQQTFLDNSAGVVVLGTTGAALSGGVSAITQGYWMAGAFAPVVLSQFNANEPVRDLFHAGGAALGFIDNRIEQLESDFVLLKGDPPQRDQNGAISPPRFGVACTALWPQREVVTSWPDGADRSAILPEIDRWVSACTDATDKYYALQTFVRSAQDMENHALRLTARDILALDERLEVQDRTLRYTPTQTLAALAAAPFLTIGSILSPDDTKSAVAALKAQNAIEGLKIRISPILVEAAPALALAPAAPVDALGRSAALRATTANPSQNAIDGVLNAVRDAHNELTKGLFEQNRQAVIAQRLANTLHGGVVTGSIDSKSRLIEVTFQPDGAPASPTPAPVVIH